MSIRNHAIMKPCAQSIIFTCNHVHACNHVYMQLGAYAIMSTQYQTQMQSCTHAIMPPCVKSFPLSIMHTQQSRSFIAKTNVRPYSDILGSCSDNSPSLCCFFPFQYESMFRGWNLQVLENETFFHLHYYCSYELSTKQPLRSCSTRHDSVQRRS